MNKNLICSLKTIVDDIENIGASPITVDTSAVDVLKQAIAALHPQPAELAEQQGDALAAFNECLTPALRVPETAAYRIAVLAAVQAATGKQQVGEVMRSDLSGYAVAASQVRRGYDVECDRCGKFCDSGPGPSQQVGVEVGVEEDVYYDIAAMIEPYVKRESSNPDGPLPASVHDSVQIIFDHWLKTRAQVGEAQGDGLASAARAGLPFIAYAFAQGVDGAEEAGRAIEAALAVRQPWTNAPDVEAVLADRIRRLSRYTHVGWRDPFTGVIKSDMVLAPDGEWVRLSYVRHLLDGRDAGTGDA